MFCSVGSIDGAYGAVRNVWGSDIKYSVCGNVVDNDDKENWVVSGGSSGGSAVAVATGSSYA